MRYWILKCLCYDFNIISHKEDAVRAEKTYRDALLIYPNKPGMILGLVSTLVLKENTDEAIELMERGLPISINEKQKSAMRATLCFLYLKAGSIDKANRLASELPHTRESREVIQPLVQQGLSIGFCERQNL